MRFPTVIFLSAFLLFQVQPIMGRYILPWFGGGPAVWTNCLLFFQALLLAGYAYAHWLTSRPGPRRQALVHIALLTASLAFLPIGPHADFWKPASSADPSARILLLLAATAGGPYLLLSATSPLLQRWFTWSAPAESPWRLYALSNLGSFLALVSYPFAIEPFLRLRVQSWIWSALYVLFAAACAWTAWRLPRVAPAPTVQHQEEPPPPSIAMRLYWLGLSAAGSTLLLATTNQISQEIAVNPFLWVAPLAIYLLTFVLAFERAGFYRRALFAVAIGLAAPAGCIVQSAALSIPLGVQLVLLLVALFVACMVCHGELARSRPAPSSLTAFYLTIAAGGAVGGFFVAWIAPRVFTEFSEYPIGLAAACLLGFLAWAREGALKQWTGRNFAVRIPLTALLLGGLTAVVATTSESNQPALASRRNFYGILRVVQINDYRGLRRELRHGSTLHGSQFLDGRRRDWPTTYYGPSSGAARALQALDRPNRRIALVGLGAGTLAAWGRAGDTFRFYEINPDVETMARAWFTFLADSRARIEIVLGDARVQLERELAAGHAADFDMILVDAFSGDTIPVHLLTAECADLYRRRLKPGGVLMLHISNRVLNLEPVARGLARHLNATGRLYASAADDQTGERTATWFEIRPDRAAPQQGREGSIVWTDDFASLWHVLMK